MQYRIFILAFLISFIVVSCNEDYVAVDFPGANETFNVTPDNVTLGPGEDVVFNISIAQDVEIIKQMLRGTGEIIELNKKQFKYIAPQSISMPEMPVNLKVFPKVDMRYSKMIVINVISTDFVVDSSICFTRDVFPILKSSCAIEGCHDSQTREEDYDFSTIESSLRKGIKPGNPNGSKIYKVLFGDDLAYKSEVDITLDDDMMPPPPYEPLSIDKTEIIRKWILEGAKNEPCSTEPINGCDTSDVSYNKTILPIIQFNCIGCHNSVKQQGNIRLDLYEEIKKVANSGALLGSINHQANYNPMPDAQIMLSKCDIRKFELWLDMGLKE